MTLSSYVGGRNRYDVTIHVPKRRIDVGGGRFAKVTGSEAFVVEGNDGPGVVTFRGSARPELFRLRWVMKAKVRAFGGQATDPVQMPYGITSDCVDDQGMAFYLGEL